MRALTFVLSAALIFGVTTNSAAQSGRDAAGAAGQQMSKETEFAQKAAAGGKMEVEMAQTAANKAINADVKAFANRLIKDHTAANQELMKIMKTKRIADAPAAPKQDAWQSQTGAAFDRGFVDHAIEHHEKDIALFETESKSGSDPELKAFATKTLPALREHLKIAQGLKSKVPGTTKQ